MGGNVTKETLASLTDHIPGLVSYHCAMLGLDKAGKTTVLYRLKFNTYMNAAPTIGFNCEKVRTGDGTPFTIWDVGGQDKLRPLWKSYTRCADAIIFVVDSSRRERLEEAKLELLRMCKGGSVPLLVLANKQDLPAALDLRRLEQCMGFTELGTAMPKVLQACCAVTGEGLEEGLGKLQELIQKQRRLNHRSIFAQSGGGKQCIKKQPRKVRRSHSHHY